MLRLFAKRIASQSSSADAVWNCLAGLVHKSHRSISYEYCIGTKIDKVSGVYYINTVLQENWLLSTASPVKSHRAVKKAKKGINRNTRKTVYTTLETKPRIEKKRKHHEKQGTSKREHRTCKNKPAQDRGKPKLTLAITSKPKIYTVQKNQENNINDAKTPVH